MTEPTLTLDAYDVMRAAAKQDYRMTKDEAIEFLEEHSVDIVDAMIDGAIALVDVLIEDTIAYATVNKASA